MGGCAVELDCARRAHAGPEPLAYPGFTPAEGGTGERRVYSALCGAFDCKLVLDILTGASAGGVNGALLGAAMKARRRLHPKFVRDSWIRLGDISRLLHETSEEEPRSLMQGELFHKDLVKAFRTLLGDEAGPGEEPLDSTELAMCALPDGQQALAPLVAKLDVTMTDVIGAERVFRDEWGGKLVARDHRARFRFREEEHYVAPLLATAARTSASFPVAFEPWKVSGKAAELAQLGECAETYGVDGGLLDNAPIRAAIDLIPGQGAENRVRRFVCYLNADPPQPTLEVKGVEPELREPALDDVVGYVVNLPRAAPFVDQLDAVEEASRRAGLAEEIQQRLLEMPQASLQTTAEALLPAYQRRRTALALEELLDEPGDVRRAMARLEDAGARLPWIPAGIAPPDGAGGWAWGVMPAARLLHLMLDLLRPKIDLAAGTDGLAALLDARKEIDRRIKILRDLHRGMTTNGEIRSRAKALATGKEPTGEIVAELANFATPYNTAAYEAVVEAYEAFAGAYEAFAGAYDAFAGAYDPFGPGTSVQDFLARALAIEAVRRSLASDADIETEQKLGFVQLTPETPTPILAEDPFASAQPAQARDKLTGVGLGHFAGFYRSAWRANDFMWGRLDAAARIVQMLVDEAEADDPAAAAETIATAVLPDAAPAAALWLVDEALRAAPGSAYAAAGDVPPELEPLRTALKAAIVADLGTDGTPVTRAVCTRAIQLEILQDELPVLVKESKADREKGSSSPALELPEGMRPAIEALRERRAAAEPLPKELDDGNEAVSDMGLRAITHAALVALSAVKAAGAPLSKLFGVVRAPVQAVSGVVSEWFLYRATVALAFWAAALYLTMRFATAKDDPTLLSDAWSRSVLLMLVAALAVLAVALVPGLRAWRTKKRRLYNGLWALAFVAAGGVVAGLLAYFFGDLSVTNVVFGAGGKQLPDWALDLVLFFTVGLGALRLPIPSGWIGRKLSANRRGWLLCVPILAMSALVAVLSIWRLDSVFDDACWQILAASVAMGAAFAAALFYLLPDRSPQ
jgi:predicted acylesterase/phospholipase RssA